MNKTRWLTALLISVMLVLHTPAAVQAAEIFEWEQIQNAVTMDELGGAFTLIEEPSLIMWLPDGIKEFALTEEDVQNGYISLYSSANGEFVCSVMRLIPDNVDIMEIDELAEVLPDHGIESFYQTQINGIDAIIYEDDEQPARSVVVGSETGAFYDIGFYTAPDESSEALVSLMISSIQPVSVLNWEDYKPWLEERNIQGHFQEFESVAMKMWIPDSLVPVELTDEDKQDGFLGYYENEDGSASVCIEYITPDIMSSDEDEAIASLPALDRFTYKQLLEQVGASDIETISVNGLSATYYEQPDQDSATVAFVTEMGNILEITFSPVSASELSDLMMGMIASLHDTLYLYWEDAEAAIEEYDLDGRFVTFEEVAVKLWLPDYLQPDERLEEAKENGFIGLFSSEDGDDIFAVQYIDMQGMDLSTYSRMVEEFGGQDLHEVTINDLYAICYWLEENDTLALAFTTESGYIIEFSATPTYDQELMAYMNLIFSSIQPE